MLTSQTNIHVQIPPLLGETLWDQCFPFNESCPVDEGKHCPVGCVNIALAQILAYYRYPSYISKKIPGYTTLTKKIYIPSIEKNTIIKWEDIPSERLDTKHPNKAVSDLLYYIACAEGTDFQTKGSSPIIRQECDTLISYFGFNPSSIRFVERKKITESEWFSLIYYELANRRPIYLCGSNGLVYHAVVIDGADGKGMFHIKWGWGGKYDGYYDLYNLNPIDSHCSGQGYSEDLVMVCGIVPKSKMQQFPLPEVKNRGIKGRAKISAVQINFFPKYVNISQRLSFELFNSTEVEYYDYVYFYQSNIEKIPSNYEKRCIVSVTPFNKKELNIEIKPSVTGLHYYWLKDSNGIIISKGHYLASNQFPPQLVIDRITVNDTVGIQHAVEYGTNKIDCIAIKNNIARFIFSIKNEGGDFDGFLYLYTSIGNDRICNEKRIWITISSRCSYELTVELQGKKNDLMIALLRNDYSGVRLENRQTELSYRFSNSSTLLYDRGIAYLV